MRALIAAALALLALPAAAQQSPCIPYPDMVAALAEDYDEHAAGVGLSGPRRLEIFAASDGETWTAVIVLPDGLACIVASGSGWKMIQPGRGASHKFDDGRPS